EGPVSAVAWHAASERMAIGDGQGVSLRALASSDAATPWRRFSGVGAVADLAFETGGALWVAANRGLWLLSEDGRLEDRSPGVGEAARRMHRVRVLGALRVAVGDGGAFASLDGRVWQRLGRGLPIGPIYSLALRDLSAGGRRAGIWLTGPLDVWRIEVEHDGGVLQAGRARRVRPPGRPTQERPVDLALDLAGSDVVVLYPQAMARMLPARVAAERWETVFPVWPPGSRARRLAQLGPTSWLVTDQGLLQATDWPLVWARTTGPPGASPMWALTEGEHGILAAGQPGLFLGRQVGSTLAATRNSLPAVFSEDPPLDLVQVRALAYASLGPDYFRRLRSGLSRRGWWPVLEIDAGISRDRSASEDEDQSFTYGELHDLHDRGVSRSRDFEASVSLSWDLGDLAYPTDAPELSREARQRVSLRDNMLNEVNQLYFDRRRTLVALEAYADRSDPEAVSLMLRAEELAAGLDGWTGGWFSAWRPPEVASTDSVGALSSRWIRSAREEPSRP
ncbi:MAG: hypothetical protein VCC04_16280, partial [Myxococcota bacterium]